MKFHNLNDSFTNNQFFSRRSLSDDQRKMNDAIILFSVKDKDYFGMSSQYVADAFMMFKDIADITSDSGTIKQLHLKLTRPQNEGKRQLMII